MVTTLPLAKTFTTPPGIRPAPKPARLSTWLVVAAAVLTASAASAQSKLGQLAKAFPRETVYYLEATVPDQLRERYSEAGLLKAGFTQEDIDLVYSSSLNVIASSLMKPLTVEETKKLIFGVKSTAVGLVDFKLPNMSGGGGRDPSKQAEAMAGIVRLLAVVEHGETALVESILKREFEGGSPSVERAWEKEGVKLYAVAPRLTLETGGQPLPGEAQKILDSMLSGVIGIVDSRYVILAGRESDILSAAEGLRGEVEEDTILPANPRFRRILKGVPDSAMMVDYLALSEILRLGDLFEPAKKALSILEVNKLEAYGGHATMSEDGRNVWGESSVIFAGDKAPEWYEILRCPPMNAKLVGMLSQSPGNRVLAHQWIGVDDLAGRLEKLREYGAPKIAEIIKLFQSGMEDGDPGLPDEGEPAEGDEEPVSGISDGIAQLMKLPTSEIAVVAYMPANVSSLTEAFRSPMITGMAWVDDSTTLDGVAETLRSLSEQVDDFLILPPAPEGSEDPSRTKVTIGEGEGAPVIMCASFGGRPIAEPSTVVLGVGHLPGHGRFIMVGTLAGIRAAAGSLAAAVKASGPEKTASASGHVGFSLNFGSFMKGMAEVVLAGPAGNEGPMAAPSDPITGKLVEASLGIFSDMEISGMLTLGAKAMTFSWGLTGLPSLDKSAELIRLQRKVERKDDVERALQKIRSQVVFERASSGGDAYPAKLAGLVHPKGLTKEDILDPMSGKEFAYLRPADGTDSFSRHMLAWQAEDQFGGIGRVVILLNGEIRVLNEKQFAAAKKLADAGKPIPRLDLDGNEIPLKGQWQGGK